MPGTRHLYGQRGREIVGFISLCAPAGDAALFKCGAQHGHFGVKIVRHRRASGFVVGQTLVPPARVAGFVIKHRDRMGGFTVADKLLQRVQAGVFTGVPCTAWIRRIRLSASTISK
jgi:hypothetical protein